MKFHATFDVWWVLCEPYCSATKVKSNYKYARNIYHKHCSDYEDRKACFQKKTTRNTF